MVTLVYLCVIRDEMLVYRGLLGQSETYDSIRKLQSTAQLSPIDSWSEVGFTYEKYNTGQIRDIWGKIVKSPGGLQGLEKVSTDGAWGILYEK